MVLTYVIPDLHGRDDLLKEGLVEITAYSRGDAGVIVTIGDYVDKGPQSKQVIDRLMSGVADGWKLVSLKGNHDALMAVALRDPSRMASWMEKGGAAALASYGGDASAVPRSHIAWLDGLQLFYFDRYRIYVHAGLEPEVALDRQSEATLLTKRYPVGFSGGFGERHIVHGHDNCPDGPLLFEGRTNLDTLAWRTGRLVIGVFDNDRPGGPVDFIVVKGSVAGR